MTETPVRSELRQLLHESAAAERPPVEEPIDEKLLEEAMRGVGTTSRNEAINAIAREYVMGKREQRRAALGELRKMSEEGAFDYSRLDDLDQ